MITGMETIRVLMICHGNICRSPMAEFVLKDMLQKKGLDEKVFVASVATSTEEIGNPVHRGTKKILKDAGISCEGKYAVQLKKEDYEKYDYLLVMEHHNIRYAMDILGGDPKGKVKRLLDFSLKPRDIADPWYTGDFDTTYAAVVEGCRALLVDIKKRLR